METKRFRCRCCGKLKLLRSKGQKYCSEVRCQQSRKNAWRRQKYAEDLDYRLNQKQSSKAWIESVGGSAKYYREYSSAETECKNGSTYIFYGVSGKWEGEMDNHWATSTNDYYQYGKDYCDDYHTGCRDHWGNNWDNGDGAFAATHGVWGGREDNRLLLKTSTEDDNPGGSGCWANSVYWKVGNNDSEFVSVFACHSGEHDREHRLVS